MAVHDEILGAVQRICRERGEWTFTPAEIVMALPHLNPRTVRTHIVSRCCVNAPTNHPHKWDYFRRIGRGRYQVQPKYRVAEQVARGRATRYAVAPLRSMVHAVVSHGDGWYSAECLELPVVTQGRTLDETRANLHDAIALHLEGEDRDALGLAATLSLQIAFEEPLER